MEKPVAIRELQRVFSFQQPFYFSFKAGKAAAFGGEGFVMSGMILLISRSEISKIMPLITDY
ncbi:MAG: hypothetical protein ACOYOO_07220 [Saprospiraceae bacterium]|jgi:hypothetical protein